MQLHQWVNLTSDGRARAMKYSFGFGTANTLAVQGDDGRWTVISPCVGGPAEALDALAEEGEVAALVAPNAFHHLGQPAWRARFPNAVSYAHEGALERLGSKAKGVPFRPISELAVPSGIKFWKPEGMKAPDLLARFAVGTDTVWFGGDLISNTLAEETALPVRIIFSLLGGGAGYRFNPVPSMVYLKDKAAWKASVRAEVEAAPPTLLLPAHGEPVRDDVKGKTVGILA